MIFVKSKNTFSIGVSKFGGDWWLLKILEIAANTYYVNAHQVFVRCESPKYDDHGQQTTEIKH